MKSHAKFRVLLLPLFGALAVLRRRWRRRRFRSRLRQRRRRQQLAVRGVPALRQLRQDVRGTRAPAPPTAREPRTDENNWLRSWTNELYLWYGEVTDRDPVAVRHRRLLRPAEDQRPPRRRASPRTSSTSPTTPTTGKRCRRAAPRPATARSSQSSRPRAVRATSSWRSRSRHAGRERSLRAATRSCRSTARTPSTATPRPSSTR